MSISGRFRQFYFLQRMLITKMKNALKSRSFLYFTLKTEKRMPVFKFHSLLCKPEKSASFSHKRPDIFSICLRYKVNQLSSVIFLSH